MDEQQPSTSSGIEKKRRKSATFQKAWLDMNIFKYWLKPHIDTEKAFCSVCRTVLACGKQNLIAHSQTEKHVWNMKTHNVSSSVPLTVTESASEDHAIKVKIAEIKLAAFYVTHNITLNIVNDMIPLLKDIFNDSKIVRDLRLKRKNCTQIIKN
ncbi:uncharacterized protein LOC112588413 [Harpegnathos saltator]|uniref:Uncharacterized protein n=1 Tax=Harpegnathos saltator TaxID=610380 RepID=E2BQ87_HARSA|nr:uncharacterized protein LOC112588413 [Harpegnathos saltator]EFN82141.1 hypothetical protein EAI_09537 [Harpegnathos saltator]